MCTRIYETSSIKQAEGNVSTSHQPRNKKMWLKSGKHVIRARRRLKACAIALAAARTIIAAVLGMTAFQGRARRRDLQETYAQTSRCAGPRAHLTSRKIYRRTANESTEFYPGTKRDSTCSCVSPRDDRYILKSLPPEGIPQRILRFLSSSFFSVQFT